MVNPAFVARDGKYVRQSLFMGGDNALLFPAHRLRHSIHGHQNTGLRPGRQSDRKITGIIDIPTGQVFISVNQIPRQHDINPWEQVFMIS